MLAPGPLQSVVVAQVPTSAPQAPQDHAPAPPWDRPADSFRGWCTFESASMPCPPPTRPPARLYDHPHSTCGAPPLHLPSCTTNPAAGPPPAHRQRTSASSFICAFSCISVRREPKTPWKNGKDGKTGKDGGRCGCACACACVSPISAGGLLQPRRSSHTPRTHRARRLGDSCCVTPSTSPPCTLHCCSRGKWGEMGGNGGE